MHPLPAFEATDTPPPPSTDQHHHHPQQQQPPTRIGSWRSSVQIPPSTIRRRGSNGEDQPKGRMVLRRHTSPSCVNDNGNGNSTSALSARKKEQQRLDFEKKRRCLQNEVSRQRRLLVEYRRGYVSSEREAQVRSSKSRCSTGILGTSASSNNGGCHLALAPPGYGRGAGGEEEALVGVEEEGVYNRKRALGRGSFGSVMLVKSSKNNRLYAMKTVKFNGNNNEMRNRALKEVRLLKMIKHPCVVSLHEVFISQDGGFLSFVMTYCESGDLHKQIRQQQRLDRPFSDSQILRWFCQICLGVHYLHSHLMMLHRDLKPSNIFLTHGCSLVKIGDFGLSKLMESESSTMVVEVGTPFYTSPEMCTQEPYSFSTDVWSIGVILYELLTLEVPFKGVDTVDLVCAITSRPHQPISVQERSPELAGLVDSMLHKSPEGRAHIEDIIKNPVLRRPLRGFLDSYRPMHVEERQRRAQIKDLCTQVESLLGSSFTSQQSNSRAASRGDASSAVREPFSWLSVSRGGGSSTDVLNNSLREDSSRTDSSRALGKSRGSEADTSRNEEEASSSRESSRQSAIGTELSGGGMDDDDDDDGEIQGVGVDEQMLSDGAAVTMMQACERETQELAHELSDCWIDQVVAKKPAEEEEEEAEAQANSEDGDHLPSSNKSTSTRTGTSLQHPSPTLPNYRNKCLTPKFVRRHTASSVTTTISSPTINSPRVFVVQGSGVSLGDPVAPPEKLKSVTEASLANGDKSGAGVRGEHRALPVPVMGAINVVASSPSQSHHRRLLDALDYASSPSSSSFKKAAT